MSRCFRVSIPALHRRRLDAEMDSVDLGRVLSAWEQCFGIVFGGDMLLDGLDYIDEHDSGEISQIDAM